MMTCIHPHDSHVGWGDEGTPTFTAMISTPNVGVRKLTTNLRVGK